MLKRLLRLIFKRGKKKREKAKKRKKQARKRKFLWNLTKLAVLGTLTALVYSKRDELLGVIKAKL